MTKRLPLALASLVLITISALLPLHYVTGQSSNGNRSIGTVSANSGSAGALALYAAAGGSTTVGPDATLSDNGTALTYSGTNVVIPAGTGAQPDLQATGSASNTGLALATTSACWSNTGTLNSCQTANGFETNSTKIFAFSSTGLATGTTDTCMSRDAAGVLDVGGNSACTQGNTTGKLKAAGLISVGTTFTSNAGCTETTLVGGATAGKFTSGTTGTCATTITMGNTATAPNGWVCDVYDQNTSVAGVTTASNGTTASISVATTSGNTVVFSCIGY